jgi:hypothetical protein
MRRICATLALMLTLVAAAPATADVYDDNPAAATRGFGDAYLFARGDGGDVLEKHWTGSTWSDWSSLGGTATSGPAAVGYYDGTIHVFVRGTDGATYENVLTNGAWSGWSSLGGISTSAPAASVRRGTNYLDLAVRGTDNTIYFRSYVPGSGWSPWGSLGGNLTSAPTLASQGDGIQNVFARGTDGAVAQRYWNVTAWGDWLSLGGGIAGAPASVSRTPGYLNLYARGAGNVTYSRSFSPSGWTAWGELDATPIDSTPAAYGADAGHEAIVARKGRDLLLKFWTSTTGWGQWTDLGPIAVPAPPAPPPPPARDGEVFLEAGLACTPPGGKLRVHITVRKQKGKARARVSRIVFFTKGKGRRVAIDHRAPFVAHLKINQPAGKSGRVYARVYFRRSKHGKLHHKTVSRRYVVCG